jgi:hypothetical protein
VAVDGPVAIATGGFWPHVDAVNDAKAGAELRPVLSVATTSTWYEPGTSGTKVGVGLFGEFSVALLPAGWLTSLHW